MSLGAPPFAAFRAELAPQSGLRAAITAAYRRPEPDCVAALLDLATPTPEQAAKARTIARELVQKLRAKKRASGVDGLMHEFDLSSQEGVALMCLAEALLRIPDIATRDALIRDKIGPADWRSHLGRSASPFVNAATWGLMLTGRLVATPSEETLSAALTRVIARSGEPVIRTAVDVAMRLLGEQFVMGRTIEEALARSRAAAAKGFAFSYDMLGEAAMTAEDSTRYLAAYEQAIGEIGRAASGDGVYTRPGISIKLSALHPRYSRSKRRRVLAELTPRLRRLASMAKACDIGLNIDAEEADRVDLSLDLFEPLAFDSALMGWNGLGFVVQAYGKRCPFIIDWLIDLARRSKRRLMVRLVKGAYWDSEVKRAQVDGLDDFPVFSRKTHTDVSYLACARKLLDAADAVFPQFATHNAQTLAALYVMAGPDFRLGDYEFQCLHGMGEPLFENVIGRNGLERPCRIYAPVGPHDTLLAYLVRRLLENGANSSFVNRVLDESVSMDELIADPVATARRLQPIGAPNKRIAAPRDLFAPIRSNARGVDLSDESRLALLADGLDASARTAWRADPAGQRIVIARIGADEAIHPPTFGDGLLRFARNDGSPDALQYIPVRNPADARDVVGMMRPAKATEINSVLAQAVEAAQEWAARPVGERADVLRRAAAVMERRIDVLAGLIVREAGRTIANAIGEVRETIDFLRYYAAEAERLLSNDAPSPLGPVVCISPWNFPLSIFSGQVAAALAAGNVVLAKPAEETPLIGSEAIRILHEAGVPAHVVQLVPGAGDVGAALVADPRVAGVAFTGSTAVARLIQKQLAQRLTPWGAPVPLIAETGGINVMIVDSSALPEQVVVDVLSSAFDSAGQRCSALRILCLQEEIADGTLRMLKGAMRELQIGQPDRLSTDIGPVISAEARDAILAHVGAMQDRGCRVTQGALNEDIRHGTYVAPAIIEVSRIRDVTREMFGPVLHVLRYRRDEIVGLIDEINAASYGLTFGLHTRIDETVAKVVDRIEAGNIYVNRNMIGANVGVQPFGGARLSGTGPKAGGPFYLCRLVQRMPTHALPAGPRQQADTTPALAYAAWLRDSGRPREAALCERFIAQSPVGLRRDLPGPVGERNIYALRPRGPVVAMASDRSALRVQIAAILATGNDAIVGGADARFLRGCPPAAAKHIMFDHDPLDRLDISAVLFQGDRNALMEVAQRLALRAGPIVPVHPITADDVPLIWLVEERVVTTNIAAIGGDASLMAQG